ncbi:AraC family transcriptional regulator [Azohydromonas lata]|uniref:AraC family transcriptional regulator n=1 Tax=Azohydromonas lata TaxID=45677 RepID=A0ABU5IPU1_9BURK|nr:AraC family transcriptional regulator [Azohydromonas lata]MDZ5460909.1 AraC family transcriptional regulator [Azohydromonas lata]
MDLLSDLLRQAGLRRRLLNLRRLSPATALRFPCDRSIGLHVVRQGQVYVHAPALDEPLALQAGDIAVMARGCTHIVSTLPMLDAASVEPIECNAEDMDGGVAAPMSAPPSPGATTVISGAWQLWNPPVHPFFAQMPAWFVLRGEASQRFDALSLGLGLLEEELQKRGLGADTVVHALLDVVFTYALRRMVQERGAAETGWSQAVHDPHVGRALALLHADSAQPWTLQALAQRCGVSRTTLAERFRDAMGDTPLNYLRTLRMQQAMRLLTETEQHLEHIALAVGYQDAFSFSKVFKRTVGVAPRDFRRRDAQEQDHPWRFRAAT